MRNDAILFKFSRGSFVKQWVSYCSWHSSPLECVSNFYVCGIDIIIQKS